MQSAQDAGGETIRVLVVDDTRIHTQLLADALRRDRQFEVSAPSVLSRDLVETVKQQRIDVVVLSSNIDEQPLRGFELLRQLRASNPGLFAVMLLDSSKRESVLHAFHAGARGICSRHDSVESLAKCIRSVCQGQIWANSEQVAFAVEALACSPVVRAVDANGLSLLSKRELEVVRSLAEGLTNREIAERLGLSQHTIKNYLFRVYDKLGVSSRLELLFMTLTQAGAPQAPGSSGPPASISGDDEPHSGRSGVVARVARTTPAAPGEEAGASIPESAGGKRNLDLERHAQEAGTQARSSRATSAFLGTDPLD